MLGEFGAHLTRDLWRVVGHSNYPPHLAYRQYRHTSFSRQICDILNSTDLFLQASFFFVINIFYLFFTHNNITSTQKQQNKTTDTHSIVSKVHQRGERGREKATTKQVLPPYITFYGVKYSNTQVRLTAEFKPVTLGNKTPRVYLK